MVNQSKWWWELREQTNHRQISGAWISLKLLIDFLLKNGIEPDAIYQAADISSGTADPDTLRLFTLYNWAAKVWGNRSIGIELAGHLRSEGLGLGLSLFTSSPTLREFCSNFDRYDLLISRWVNVNFREHQDYGELCYRVMVPNAEPFRHFVEFFQAIVLLQVRRYNRATWLPLRIDMAYPRPSNIDIYTRFFGDRVFFDQATNRILIDKEAFRHSNFRLDRDSHDHLKCLSDQLLFSAVGRRNTVLFRTRTTVVQTLGTDLCNAADTARALCMSRSTLARQLGDLGTSFREIKSDVMRERSRKMLIDTSARVTQIGEALGYSETSAFDRAFRKSSGMTPLTYRRKYKNQVFTQIT